MRRSIGVACIVSSSVLIWASFSVAATLLVKPDGTGDYATIQAAIDAAAVGDVVSLADGVYRGDGNRDLDYHGKAIIVRSASGDYNLCVIDCEGTAATPHRGFWFHTSESSTSVLEGVTVRGGYAVEYGGGIYCATPTGFIPTVRNCRLTGNTAPRGAGIAFWDGGGRPSKALPVALTSCLVDANTGCGLYMNTACSFTTRNSRFNGNSGAGAIVDGGFTANSPGMEFVSCEFSRNGAEGFSRKATFNTVKLDSCTVDANSGHGIGSYGNQDDGMRVANTSITNNLGGGVFQAPLDNNLSLLNCTITGNHGFGVAGSMDSYGFDIINCRIAGTTGGPGILDRRMAQSATSPPAKAYFSLSVLGSEIDHNDGAGIDLVSDASLSRIDIETSVVHDNGDAGIRFGVTNAWGRPCAVTMDSLTVALNGGAGVVFATEFPVDAHEMLVASNGGPGVTVSSGAVPTFSCSDIHGNRGGDWIGPIAGQLGVSGNFSADPLFGDASSGLFTLQDGSPCLPGRNPTGADCGQVGALGAQCFTDSPVITAVSDVPNDQGELVQLTWQRSRYDAPGATVGIVGYAVFRKQDRARPDDPAGRLRPAGTESDPKLRGWDYLLTVPATGKDANVCMAPTPGDSTAAGACEMTFLVRALTDNPATFYDSAPARGHSVDNLAPESPKNLALDGHKLRWDRAPEADFHHFTIYGSDANVLAGAVCLGQTKTSNLNIHGQDFAAYLVTATDHSGNEGKPASSLGELGAAAKAQPVTLLHPASPNPFNPATVVRFELATPGSTSLRIYDVSGRLVRTLVAGEILPAGSHEARWDGRSDSGAPAAAGIYLCRLASAGVVQSRTLMLVK